MNLFDTHFLFASLIWGSVAIGYFVYGKKQSSLWAMLGGVAMLAASVVVSSALLMSVICIAIMVGVYVLTKRGE